LKTRNLRKRASVEHRLVRAASSFGTRRRHEAPTTVSRAQPQRSDTVLVHYTGWRQRTRETFFTPKGISQPMALDVAHAALGFSEVVLLLRKSEKAVLWVPPGQLTGETLVYEIEVVDIVTKRRARQGRSLRQRAFPPAKQPGNLPVGKATQAVG
jgi:hypothetical protein